MARNRLDGTPNSAAADSKTRSYGDASGTAAAAIAGTAAGRRVTEHVGGAVTFAGESPPHAASSPADAATINRLWNRIDASLMTSGTQRFMAPRRLRTVRPLYFIMQLGEAGSN